MPHDGEATPGAGSDAAAGISPTRPFGPRPPRRGATAAPTSSAAGRRIGGRTAVIASAVAVAVAGAVMAGAGALERPAPPTVGGHPRGSTRPPRVTGPVVEHAGHSYAMGRPGDVALLGDWDCDGLPTPALYRPSTGQAWVFHEWATTDSPAPATAARRHRRGGVASVQRAPGGCDRLTVVPHENA